MNQNLAFLNSFTNINEETFGELLKIATLKTVKAGTQIVKLGEVTNEAYLLVDGVFRCYLITEDGKEFNKSFYLPNSFFAPFTALLTRKPSLFVFEALTDCTIYEIEFCKLRQLCEENLVISNLYARVLEAIYTKYESRLVELITLDAKARYLELKKQIPDVDNLIPQYHIASYLGITPVQLSRIRKKIDSD